MVAAMTQAFNVRLKAVGINRVQVLAMVRQQSGLGAKEFRRLADAGDLVVAEDVPRHKALGLADRLRDLGAQVEVELSIDDCC
jgi:large subunit ribosomal protein L7/L12